MYTVGLDVDTHSIMNNLAAGVLGINYKNYSSTNKNSYYSTPILDQKYPQTSPSLLASNPLGRGQAEGRGMLPDASQEIGKISDHMKKHEKPLGEAEFGYYLAGLIEGDGYFGDQRLEILFFEKDITLAYYIKKRIGYGSVYFIKDKRAVKYFLRHTAGLKYVLDLVNGKFLTNCKINQLLKHDYGTKFMIMHDKGGQRGGQVILPPANFSLMTNHYLAGFTDSDGYFGISTPKDKSSKHFSGGGIRVRLRFVLGQKYPTILQKVKSEFGGYLYHYKSTDNYLLELSSFSQNLKVIEYFDKFNLNSIKHLAFFKWRKAYRIVQRKEHLTEKGLSKIKLLGKSISELIK
jgi:hypothetical protein